MVRLAFICHGNICRSPMAEMIFENEAQAQGFNDYYVFSMATSAEELGNPIYPPARRELVKRGVPIKEHYATKLSIGDYDKYDMFICMDNYNLRNMKRIFSGRSCDKCYTLMSFTERVYAEVSDPWYSGDFSKAYEDIHEGIMGLISYLKIQQGLEK